MPVTCADFLYQKLKSNAAVLAIVGENIFPYGEETAVYPRIVYKKIRGDVEHDLSGASGLRYPIYQIACYSREYAQAEALAEAAIDALDSFTGTMGGLSVQDCHFLADGDLSDEKTKIFGRWMDFEIWHQKAIT